MTVGAVYEGVNQLANWMQKFGCDSASHGHLKCFKFALPMINNRQRV
jgi:hypothetical protein